MPASPEDLDRRLQAIRLIVLDVDGVLTDGVIAIDDRGVETKHFSVRDGAAIALWNKGGGRVAILSGRKAESVDRRALELGIAPVVQGVKSKKEPFLAILSETGCASDESLFVGDDWADLPAMEAAGLSACPADAAEEVLAAADLIADAPGGRGAVRSIIQTILKARGQYESLVATFRPIG